VILITILISIEPWLYTAYLNVINETLAAAELYDIPYLIIDVRDNSGGDICLGYQVVDALTQEPFDDLFGRYDLRQTTFLNDMAVVFAQPPYPSEFLRVNEVVLEIQLILKSQRFPLAL
jgi:hypothetical protein